MGDRKYRVAIIGCSMMGQIYADAYSAYPDTEIVALAEHAPPRQAVWTLNGWRKGSPRLPNG